MVSTTASSADWFVSAIVKDGTVGECLSAVEQELRQRQAFVIRLREKIAEKSPSKIDSISDINARISVLENTLKLRLSILSPSRRGAWFRPSASTASGPFAVALFNEPVFATYDETLTARIRAGLIACWDTRNLLSYPLKASESCLWKILLSLNFELHQLGDFGDWPRLEKLPDDLPFALESRALRAFLANVRAEYLSARQRLDECYQVLLNASHAFWSEARVLRSSKEFAPGVDDFYDGHRVAEKMRQEFRSRRTTPTIKRPIGKSAQDIEALNFMGFDDFPDADALKQRYHNLAMEMHPDREGGSEARFKLLARSYRHLIRNCQR